MAVHTHTCIKQVRRHIGIERNQGELDAPLEPGGQQCSPSPAQARPPVPRRVTRLTHIAVNCSLTGGAAAPDGITA